MRRFPSRSVFLIPLLLWLFFHGTASATIVVKPGKLDHFVVTVLNQPVAGEYFLVKVEAYDSRGNFITEYTGPGEGFQIKVGGQAKVTPAVIKAKDFSGGVVVKVMDEKAEEVELSVMEEKANVPITSTRLTVKPNKLDHFDVSTPQRVTAGETFQVRLVTRDVFGNLIYDFADGAGIRFDIIGRGSVRPGDIRPSFKNGEAVVDLSAEKAGDLKLSVRDTATTAAGQSQVLTIVPAKADHFSVIAPRTATAGEKINIALIVFDRYENQVSNFAEEGDDVIISSSTGGQIKPSSVDARSFDKGGRVELQVVYEKADTFKIIAEGKNRGPRGESEMLTVNPAEPDHFVLTTPSTAVAGEPFTVNIEAMDRFSNTITNYNLIGTEVFLSADGTGQLNPASVSPSLFKGGKAEVKLSYSKAESFNLQAALKVGAKKRAEAPPKELTDEERKRLDAERSRREMEDRLNAQREKERQMALKAKEEAQKAREAAMKVESPKGPPQVQPVPLMTPPQPVIPATPAAPVAPSVPPPPVETKVQPPLPPPQAIPGEPKVLSAAKPATTAKPEVKPAPAKPETAKPSERPAAPPREEKAKPAPLQVAKNSLQRLEGISMMEAQNQAMILLNLSGPVNYDVTMSSSQAKAWIYVDLNPAQRDRDKVLEKMTANSTLIGQVVTTDKGDNKLEVAIEILPKNISYTVEQDGKAVVIKITKAQ